MMTCQCRHGVDHIDVDIGIAQTRHLPHGRSAGSELDLVEHMGGICEFVACYADPSAELQHVAGFGRVTFCTASKFGGPVRACQCVCLSTVHPSCIVGQAGFPTE